MYCTKKEKCYSAFNTICPLIAYYNQPMTPIRLCYMAEPNIVQGGGCPYQNYPMSINYSGYQMNSMVNPNFYRNNTIDNMGISMMPVSFEEIED